MTAVRLGCTKLIHRLLIRIRTNTCLGFWPVRHRVYGYSTWYGTVSVSMGNFDLLPYQTLANGVVSCSKALYSKVFTVTKISHFLSLHILNKVISIRWSSFWSDTLHHPLEHWCQEKSKFLQWTYSSYVMPSGSLPWGRPGRICIANLTIGQRYWQNRKGEYSMGGGGISKCLFRWFWLNWSSPCSSPCGPSHYETHNSLTDLSELSLIIKVRQRGLFNQVEWGNVL